MFELVNVYSVLVASVAIFLFGWLWYSPWLFAKPWMDAVGKTKESMMANRKEMPKVMAFGFLTGLITTYSLAVILGVIEPESLPKALQISIFLCFSFIITTKFTELIYESKEPHWSKRPQMLFLISSGYHLGSFIIATIIIWFFMYGF